MKLQDLNNRTFGSWTVIARTKAPKGRHDACWSCRCSCGAVRAIMSSDLISGKSTKCRKCVGEKRHKTIRGYVVVKCPKHGNAWPNGYVREHVLVMSKHLGRPLHKYEVVHHKNGVKNDNRLTNLELLSKPHPYGQRVVDLVAFCVEQLRVYAPHTLKDASK